MHFICSYQPKEVLEAGAKATDTLTQSVLGSLIVILVIVVFLLLRMLWKSKTDEISLLKEVMNANADERVASKEFAQEQLKAYERLADTVNDLTLRIENMDKRVDEDSESIISEIKKSLLIVDESVKGSTVKIGKRVDLLVDMSENVDKLGYYAKRD